MNRSVLFNWFIVILLVFLAYFIFRAYKISGWKKAVLSFKTLFFVVVLILFSFMYLEEKKENIPKYKPLETIITRISDSYTSERYLAFQDDLSVKWEFKPKDDYSLAFIEESSYISVDTLIRRYRKSLSELLGYALDEKKETARYHVELGNIYGDVPKKNVSISYSRFDEEKDGIKIYYYVFIPKTKLIDEIKSYSKIEVNNVSLIGSRAKSAKYYELCKFVSGFENIPDDRKEELLNDSSFYESDSTEFMIKGIIERENYEPTIEDYVETLMSINDAFPIDLPLSYYE